MKDAPMRTPVTCAVCRLAKFINAEKCGVLGSSRLNVFVTSFDCTIYFFIFTEIRTRLLYMVQESKLLGFLRVNQGAGVIKYNYVPSILHIHGKTFVSVSFARARYKSKSYSNIMYYIIT
jgi:hypothetical protein